MVMHVMDFGEKCHVKAFEQPYQYSLSKGAHGSCMVYGTGQQVWPKQLEYSTITAAP